MIVAVVVAVVMKDQVNIKFKNRNNLWNTGEVS